MPVVPTRVPNQWTGVSRRSYQNVYAKGAEAKVKHALGQNKLSTPTMKPPKDPSATKTALKNSQKAYSAGNQTPETSFGATGQKESFYGPLSKRR